MKTTFTAIIASLVFAVGAFADQPSTRVIYSPKGQVLAVVPNLAAGGHREAQPQAATYTTCGSMLVVPNNQKSPAYAVNCNNRTVMTTTACKLACAR